MVGIIMILPRVATSVFNHVTSAFPTSSAFLIAPNTASYLFDTPGWRAASVAKLHFSKEVKTGLGSNSLVCESRAVTNTQQCFHCARNIRTPTGVLYYFVFLYIFFLFVSSSCGSKRDNYLTVFQEDNFTKLSTK